MNRRSFMKITASTALGVGLSAGFARRLLGSAQSSVYWGAYISGSTYGTNPATGQPYSSPPWDLATWDLFEAHAGKRISILHWGQSWVTSNQWPYGYCTFPAAQANTIRGRGAIPMLDWSSCDSASGGSLTQPNFTLANIINGAHDAYIRQWATDAKNWAYPLFLRFKDRK